MTPNKKLKEFHVIFKCFFVFQSTKEETERRYMNRITDLSCKVCKLEDKCTELAEEKAECVSDTLLGKYALLGRSSKRVGVP